METYSHGEYNLLTLCMQSFEKLFSALLDIWSSNPESSEGELLMQAQASRLLPSFSQNALWLQVGRISPGGEAGVGRPGGGGSDSGVTATPSLFHERGRLLWLQTTLVSDILCLSKERNRASLCQWRAALGQWPKAGQASVTLRIQKPKFLFCFVFFIFNSQWK